MRLADINRAQQKFRSETGERPTEVNIPEHCVLDLLDEMLATRSFPEEEIEEAIVAHETGDSEKVSDFFNNTKILGMRVFITPTVS